jgi:predicted nucleic acid-binding protein
MLLQNARRLAARELKAKDALHIACAIAGACTYFVTTDDDILKCRQEVHEITVIDPTAFVREMNL